MIILRRFRDFSEEPWEPVTIEDFLDHTEGSGYLKKGTALKELEKGYTVSTPFAKYKEVL